MTVNDVSTSPLRGAPARVLGRPGIGGTVQPPTQRTIPAGRGPLCLAVPQIAEGDGATLVHNLRRRQSTRAVLLTRKAGRRELLVLLSGGVRGAVTAETPPATTPAPGRPALAVAGPELTARELGVLSRVADGRSNRQIGEDLALSALTVKSHLARISRKIGTGDRAEMVAYVIRHALLP